MLMTSTSRSLPKSFSSFLLTAGMLTVALLAFVPVAFGQAENPGGDPAFVPLFNGKDLTNFQTKDADTFWRIEDGVLIGENDPAKREHYLWTTKKYSDFILDFDAKWKGTTKRGVDTGIELREPKLQLQLGISGSLRVDMTGSFYAGRKGYPESGQATEAKRLLNPEGEWNSFQIGRAHV